MKRTCRGTISLVTILIFAPLIHGQDLSKYRNFSFGMSMASVSKQMDVSSTELQMIHQRPARIEELTWYPPQPFGASRPAEPVREDSLLFRQWRTLQDARDLRQFRD